MHMTPPEAPPAITRDAAEDSAALIARIADTQRWLVDQQALLPTLPMHEEPSIRTSFMAELAAFWRAPVAPSPGQPSVTRQQAFVLRWATLMADVATLGVADGELDEAAKQAVLGFTGTQGHLVPPYIHVRELVVDAQAYAGTVVITDGRDVSALLFSPDRGWEKFSGLDALHVEFEQRLRERLASGDAPSGLGEDDHGRGGDIQVTSRDIPGNAFDVLAANIVDVQRRKVTDAWSWRDEGEGRDARRADRIHDALRPEHYIDAAALLRRRQIRLLAAAEAPRLAQLPLAVRQQWETALADYGRTWTATYGVLATEGFPSIASIDRFARDELAVRLRSRAVAIDPADIVIELFSTTASPPTGYSGTDVEQRTLLDLARENFGFLEMRGMQARTTSGRFLLALGRDAIVDMLRELDLRNRYQAYLVEQLKTSAQGQRVRQASAQLQEARMRFELVDARSSAFVAGEERAFIDDHAERGYRWVEAILDAPVPAARRRIENHDIVVSHIVYEGARMKDVLAIGVRAQGSVYRTILYTPDAPDGRSFREFGDRQEAAGSFLNHPDFEQYVLERLPSAWATVGPDGVSRHFRVSTGTRRAVWALSGQRGEHPYTLTEGRFTEAEITGNIFDATYDVALGQLGRDAADLARSTGEADFDHATSIGMLSAHVAEGFLPLRLGVAVGGIRALHAAWRGVENVGRDDRVGAFEDFVDAFSRAGDLAGSRMLSRSIGRTWLTRLHGRAQRLAVSPRSLPDLDATFESRYIATAVRLQDAGSIKNGVYDIRGRPYIEHRGRAYGVRFDRENNTWRLEKPGMSPASYAPPVVRDTTGQWRHNTNVGLRGGFDGPDLYDREPADVLAQYRGLNLETANLSDSDVRVVVQTLARQGLGAGAAKRLIYARTHEQPTSATMARYWDAALAHARRPPSRLPTPPPATPDGFELVKLERSQWPDKVWHYTTPYRHATFTGTALTLSQSLPASTGPSGVHVMTLDPGRPSRTIVEVMRGQQRTNTFTDTQVQTIAGAYVEIDLAKLRDRQRSDGTFEFNVYTVTRRSGVEFVIKPTLPAPDPRIAPLSPRRQRDLAGVSLRAGEFRTGLRLN